MSGMFSAISFDSLADDLRRSLIWIEDAGIITSPTRLAKYRTLMDEVIEVAELRDLDRANEGFTKYVGALFEAHEIVQCWQGLGNLPAARFKQRLRDIVSGPVWYSDENSRTSSNLARNSAFELLVAAQFSRSGLTIDDEISVDVAVSSPHALLVECKRPQSLKALTRIIKGAKRQLTQKLRQPRRIGFRGMVALDLTKLANPQFESIVAPSAKDARLFTEKYVSDFIDTNAKSLNLARVPKLVGFLTRLSAIARCVDTSSLIYCQQWGLAQLPDLSSRDRQVFKMFASQLDAAPPSWS
jgi:hypothetical protein